MEISSFDNQQIVSSLTIAELEFIVTQIVQKIISREKEILIPNEYKRELSFDSNATPFWQMVVDNSNKIPEEIWDTIPNDASENIDSYLHDSKI